MEIYGMVSQWDSTVMKLAVFVFWGTWVHIDGHFLVLSLKDNNKQHALFFFISTKVDEDGSGYLEFEEFCQLSAKFLVEEDEESMKKELKEAFRIYDKEGRWKFGCFLRTVKMQTFLVFVFEFEQLVTSNAVALKMGTSKSK